MKKPTNEWLQWLMKRDLNTMTSEDKDYFLDNYEIKNWNEPHFVRLCFDAVDGICQLSGEPMSEPGSNENNVISIDHVTPYKSKNKANNISNPNVLRNFIPASKDANSSKGNKDVEAVNTLFGIDLLEVQKNFNNKIVDIVLTSLYQDWVNDKIKDLLSIMEDEVLIRTKKCTFETPALTEKYGRSGTTLGKYFEDVLGHPVEIWTAAKVLFEENREEILKLLREGVTLTKIRGDKYLNLTSGSKGDKEFDVLCANDHDMAHIIEQQSPNAKMISDLQEAREDIINMLSTKTPFSKIAEVTRMERNTEVLKLYIDTIIKDREHERQKQEYADLIDKSNVNVAEISRALSMLSLSFNGDLTGISFSDFSMSQNKVTLEFTKENNNVQ